MKEAEREILLSFWKVHILHHAGEAPIHGQWMLNELRHHGYDLSPGTLYPILHRMERRGWLKSSRGSRAGLRARKDYVLTAKGRRILTFVRRSLAELHREVGSTTLNPTRRDPFPRLKLEECLENRSASGLRARRA